MNRVRSALSRSPFLLAPLYLALTACGGSDNASESERYNANPDQNQATEGQTESVERVSLTGLAVKGVVHGARAELFRVIDGAVENTAYATGQTDDEGRYELSVISQEAYAGPALVRISWQDGAEMTCDADAGCGNYGSPDVRDTNTSGTIDFGERFDLETDFQMAVLIPYLATSSSGDQIVTAHVSSLTNAAAALAQNGLISQASVEAANNQIRAVLGLEDDIDIVITPPIDVTGNNALPGSAEYGAITAAIAEIARNRGISFNDALASLATQFLNNDGQLLWNDNGTLPGISIEEVATAALAIAQLLGNSELASKFQQLIDLANTKQPDMMSDIHPPIANAGADQTVDTGTSVTLAGSNQAAGQSSYAWAQVSGTPVVLSADNAQQTTFNSGLFGDQLVFRLTVTNQTTGHSDIDYVTVSVTQAIASDETLNSLNGSKYTLWNPAVYLNSETIDTAATNLGYGLEVEQSLTLTTTGNETSPLSLTPSGNIRNWAMLNHYQAGQFFTGNIARSTTAAELEGDTEIGDTTPLNASLSNLNELTVQLPQMPDEDGDLVGLSLADSAQLMQLAPGTWFGAHVDQTDFFTAEDANKETREPVQHDYFVNTPLLVQDSGNFSEESVAEQYGVISVAAGSDTTLSQLVGTELQQWQISSEVDGVLTAVANSLDDQASLGYRIMSYSHQVELEDDRFSVATSPYSVEVRTEVSEREEVEINFSVRSNGQLRVPSSLLDSVFDSEDVALEGIASSDGAMLMAQLMGELDLGNFAGTEVSGIAYERYIALATSANAPNASNFTDSQYQIKGLLFDVSASSRGISAMATSGALQFGDGSATLALDGDAVRLQNAGFVVSRTQPEFLENSDSLNLTLKANGYVQFEVGQFTLEGFASSDGNTLALRVMDNNLFAKSTRRASQGFLIARKVN